MCPEPPAAPENSPSGIDAELDERPARPVDPFRGQLDSQPRELARPGQSGFFRPEAGSGRYSLKDMPAEEVVVRTTPVTPVPVAVRQTPTPKAQSVAPLNTSDSVDRSSAPPPVEYIEIPGALRAAAQKWCQTGTLPVASDASSGRARALQRAALIALLQDSPLTMWPHSLIERAEWLFRPGWDESKLETDACLALLDLPSEPNVLGAIQALIASRLHRASP